MHAHAQRCNKHNALAHDFFVSYRVSEDSINSEKLAAHLDGRLRPDGNNFITYLDKNCLIQGKDWEDGFKYGINNSKAILLLISKGVVTSMITKATRGDEDNVLKEHKIALDLIDKGRLVIPIYVAQKTQTADRRDCYIKLNREASLRLFDNIEAEPAVRERLQNVRQILEQIFSLPSFVNIEPDLISEQVPKIIQMWHAKFMQENNGIQGIIAASKKEFEEPGGLKSFFLYPSQSFRLSIIGVLLGIFGFVLTLSLLFAPSKSKRHTDLKRGVAAGNVIGFIVVIILSIVYCSIKYKSSTEIYCLSCEAVISQYSNASIHYFETVPRIEEIVDECRCFAEDDPPRFDMCLICVCENVYRDCDDNYSVAVALMIVVALQAVFIGGTMEITRRFTKKEEFSFAINAS